jgi:peptidoglycan-associated lipoprotein
MRRMSLPARRISSLCIVALVGLGAMACSRSAALQPEARLGSPVNANGRNGSGAFGNGFGQGPAGSPQQFQSAGIDTVYFSSDSVTLTPDAEATLVQQARWLNEYPSHTLTVEGHADERGTREYNIALGERRATTVKAFLTARGVNAARIRTLSYGKERPVASCNDISCWSQNRRAQTVLAATAISRK